MKKIVVNTDQCISCGACVALDPEHFEFDDSGLSVVISQENLESEELMNAIESCPVAVIYTEDVTEDIDNSDSVLSPKVSKEDVTEDTENSDIQTDETIGLEEECLDCSSCSGCECN